MESRKLVTQDFDLEAELATLRRLSLESGGDSKGWRFNRAELYDRPSVRTDEPLAVEVNQ